MGETVLVLAEQCRVWARGYWLNGTGVREVRSANRCLRRLDVSCRREMHCAIFYSHTTVAEPDPAAAASPDASSMCPMRVYEYDVLKL